MGKGKKKFIDKKNAVTFHLVHRSQRDPLAADENAPQHVLLEAKPTESKKQKEEQKKYGIFFDDDYDYLQHLKEPERDTVWEYVPVANDRNSKNKTKTVDMKTAEIQLPSSVFASEFEEDEGLLNKAAPHPGPRPDWDPDIVAALDEDFDFDDPNNQLEDDFIVKAMEEDVEGNGDNHELNENDEDEYIDSDDAVCSENEYISETDEDEEIDTLGPLRCPTRKHRFSEEETESHFTEYSMSSSVIPRSEHLTLLDDRFEKFYATYNDAAVGALDMENIEGSIDTEHPIVLNCYEEFKGKSDVNEYKKEWDKERIKHYIDVNKVSDEEELVEMKVEDDNEKKWDCESILSTYSNIYNHPKLIEEPKRNKNVSKIRIDPKTGIPMDVLRDHDKLTLKTLEKLDAENAASSRAGGPKSLCDKSIISTLSVLSIKPKDETPEEKRERKRLLKQYRAERRMEKKANAEAFKDEKKRQQKIKINNQNNPQGNRIL